jgi:hypothetical protein
MYGVIGACLLSASAGMAADVPSVRLATSPSRETVTVVLGDPPAAFVREERQIGLAEGATDLELSWAGTKLAADSLEVAPIDPGAELQISGPVLPADRPQLARWTLTAPRAMRVPLSITYLMNGVTWAPEYTLTFGETPGRMGLAAVAAIKNDSGEDFESARVDLGLSAPITVDLEAGATLRVPYLDAANVSYQLVHVHDAKAGGDTLVRLDLENTIDAGLGAAPLPAGKVRMYGDFHGRTPDERIFTGEFNLPYTPVGARAEVVVATGNEVTVERRVIVSRQVDVKKDVHGRLALYNQEEEIAFLVESLRDNDILLRIVETIEGEWRMLSNSHEFEKQDAEHIEFIVPVPAHDEVTVKYKVRKLNLVPR